MSSPQEMFRRLQQVAENAQQQGRRMGGGGNPRGPAGLIAGGLLLGGLYVIGSNSLFNGTRYRCVNFYDVLLTLSCS